MSDVYVGASLRYVYMRVGVARALDESANTRVTSPWPAGKRVARALADSSDFGLLGSKVHKNRRFPAFDANEPPCKM